MTRKTALSLAAIVCNVPVTAAQSWEPSAFTSSYIIHSTGLDIGRMEQKLRLVDTNRYAFRAESYAIGMAALLFKEHTTEETLFKLNKQRILAMQYHYNRLGGRNNKQQEIVFNRSQQVITGQTNENKWQLPWTTEPFDNLLYQIGMWRDASLGKPEFSYTIVDNGQTKEYRFARVGQETLDTPLGKFETIKYARTHMPEKRVTTIWSAPKLHYLPVQLFNIDRNGRAATVRLEKISGMDLKVGPP